MSEFRERAIDGGAELWFKGVDQDAKDSAEISNLTRGMSESPVVSPPPRPRYWKLSVGISLTLLFLTTVLALLAIFPSEVALPVSSALATVVALIVGVSWRRMFFLRVAPALERRAISFDGRTFTLATAKGTVLSLPEDDIVGFEGGRRLVLLRTNGTQTTLPCVVTDGDHAAVVPRLNELLVQTRAARAGYRGVRVASTTATEEIDAEATALPGKASSRP